MTYASTHRIFCFLLLLLLILRSPSLSIFFFFNDTATTEIYTLSLHDALPIFYTGSPLTASPPGPTSRARPSTNRSEEHTSELQSRSDLVCRLLLEKKKIMIYERMYAMYAYAASSCLISVLAFVYTLCTRLVHT